MHLVDRCHLSSFQGSVGTVRRSFESVLDNIRKVLCRGSIELADFFEPLLLWDLIELYSADNIIKDQDQFSTKGLTKISICCLRSAHWG